ncbi:glycosyltransferase [Paenibacillus oryzae]
MLTSIVILTHNQLPLTIQCLDSIRKHTKDYEIIVVDNGSTDGTVDYLETQTDLTVVINKENLGFAKGCNQGTELSRGDNVLYLNNDTIVAAHWLENLLRVLYENERVGMVGPVTNRSSGHQCIPVPYSDISGLDEFARHHLQENAGRYLEVRRLIGFCLLVKRKVLDEIGCFDERYGLGNYEDDDLCLRALRAGYSLRVVLDSFIHHVGHATMHTLQRSNLNKLLAENRQKASEKWGNDIHQLIYTPGKTMSLCMIVRNAEGTLKQSLASVKDDVDEIIIIDTGSCDQTVEIAKQYTPHVYSIAEQEDALQAYRYAWDQATKEYVFFMRQDEVLTIHDIKKLYSLRFSMDESQDLISFRSPDVGTADDEKAEAGDAPPLRYMFRREAGFRSYEGLLGISRKMITISLCMIVRNEEEELEKCLSSVKDIADEIVIVDTGSTDRTKEIAAQFTDRILDFKGNDDFSAARNYAFRQATQQYILWLDADDYISDKDRQLFLELKKTLDFEADSITMHYNRAFDEKGNVTSSVRQNRLVRRDRNFQWIGNVHEYLAVWGTIRHSEVSINNSKNKTFTDRNLQMYLKREQAGEVFTARDLYHFANELLDHARYEDAIQNYRKFLEGKQGSVEDNIQACMRLGECYGRLGDKKKRVEALCMTLLFDKPRAGFCCALGGYFLEEKQYENAIYWFTEAIKSGKDENHRGAANQMDYTWNPHLQLCVCYDRMGLFEKANEHNEKALSYHPTHPSMLFNKQYFKTKLGERIEYKPVP